MGRLAISIFVFACLNIVDLSFGFTHGLISTDWDEIDLTKLNRVAPDEKIKDPGFDGSITAIDDADDPVNALGVEEDDDHVIWRDEDEVQLPVDANEIANCSAINDLRDHDDPHHHHHHHHHSCGRAFGYSSRHCHCDWGHCTDSHRPHSYCGCPWGRCRQDRPKYCKYIWKYCEHHHHEPGIEPRGSSKDIQQFKRIDQDLSIHYPWLPSASTPGKSVPPTTEAPAPPTVEPSEEPTTEAPEAPTTEAPAPSTAAPTTKAPTTVAPTTRRPSHGCGPYGYATFACMCPMGSCYSKCRPHGYCGCPWGYCKNKRPEFCRYFWKHCRQPHCISSDDSTPISDLVPSATDVMPNTTPPPPSTPEVDCGDYGVASDKCKCTWYKCRFWPHRPSAKCGCPWGYCREDRPRECRAETPNPHDLMPTSEPRPTGHHPHPRPHGNCGHYGVATKDCKCLPGNCRADRPSADCGCPWGQCDQRRPYHCKWRGTEPDHHHHHHHHPPHHHHHHHHSGSSSSSSSESSSWEDKSSEDNGRGLDPEEEEEENKMQMVIYGAMGFMICALGFLFIATIVSMVMKKARSRPTYANLATTPIEINNPLSDVLKKPEDKEKLVS